MESLTEISKSQRHAAYVAFTKGFKSKFTYYLRTIESFEEYVDPIHRMQIWRTTRLAPGTSRMEARLVRLWCFVLTMLFPKSLALLSTWSFCFALSTRFSVAECHRKRVKSSTAEKAFFFSVSSFVS